jgi:PAS domain S-box-containing protein
MLRDAARQRGHEITLCETAELAMAACGKDLFSLILLDLILPGLDGLGFARWVRSQPWGDQVFILVATECDQPSDLRAVLQAGGNDYVAKPYDGEALQIRLAVAERFLSEVAARKKAQDTSQLNENRFRSFMNHFPGVTWMKDLDGRYVYFNEPYGRLVGAALDDWRGKTDTEVWPADIAAEFHRQDRHVLQSKESLQLVSRIPIKGNADFWLVNKFPVLNAEGEVMVIAGLAVNVTKQRQIEEMNQTILRNAMDGFWLIDPAGKILEVNNAYCAMTGYTHEELIGKPIHQIRADGSAERVQSYIQAVLRHGQARVESQHRAKDGRLIDFEVSLNRVEIAGEARVTSFFRDITERKKISEELLKVSRLESIGLLAGGIAHEFNNALTTIIGNIMLTQAELPSDHPNAEWLKMAAAAASRATQLAKQLLTFAKGGEPIKKIGSVEKLLQERLEHFYRDKHVPVLLEFSPGLWTVEFDSAQIGQVIENLLQNASEAVGGKGDIRIVADNVTVQADKIPNLSPGRYVKFSVVDNGHGVPAEILPKIFDPYFTTRAGSQGLGLAICFSIVKKHGGTISVESIPGKGTTFTVYLPAAGGAARNEIGPDPKAPQEHNRLLVMDDDEDILELMSTMLRRKGYEVSVSRDGREAIDLYVEGKTNGSPFDAVIMDLTVPEGLGGKATMTELLKIDPAVRGIVCSGYSSDPVIANFREYGFVASLPKPFTVTELMRVVAEVLST